MGNGKYEDVGKHKDVAKGKDKGKSSGEGTQVKLKCQYVIF